LVDAAGAVTADTEFVVPAPLNAGVSDLQVGFDGMAYRLAWIQTDSSKYVVLTARVKPDGSLIDSPIFAHESGISVRLSGLGCDPTNRSCLLAFTESEKLHTVLLSDVAAGVQAIPTGEGTSVDSAYVAYLGGSNPFAVAWRENYTELKIVRGDQNSITYAPQI